MSVLEKIWYTWLILAIPFSLFAWMFFDEDERNLHVYILADCDWISINAYMGNRASMELMEREDE